MICRHAVETHSLAWLLVEVIVVRIVAALIHTLGLPARLQASF